MFLKKFTLTKSNKSLAPSDQELREHFLWPRANEFVIELIEIANCNPSHLTIHIRQSDSNIAIPLYRHRKEFIYQAGIFIWETKEPHFTMNLSESLDFQFFVESAPDLDFELTLYGYTDQESRLFDQFDYK